MDPKNYQNYTWINLCSLLPIQKVLKTNPNWIVALTPNLIESFSTLRFFFLDTSVCKHRTWHIVQNLLNFFTIASTYDIMRSWQISWCLDIVCFFYNLKTKWPHVHGRVFWTRCSKFLFIPWVRPYTRLSNMNIIFLLILSNYLYHLQFKFDLYQKIPWKAIN